MRSSPVLSIVLVGVGVALFVWGFTASDSLSSQTSGLLQGAPSAKAIGLLVVGFLVGSLGVVRLLRRPAA